jgi:hypothetical protein
MYSREATVADCSEGSGSPNHHFSLDIVDAAASLHDFSPPPLSPSSLPSCGGESTASDLRSISIHDSRSSSQESPDGMFPHDQSASAEKVPRPSTTSRQVGAVHRCGHGECQAAFSGVDLLMYVNSII